MNNNTCRTIFTDTAKTVWCCAMPERLNVGGELKDTGKQVITCHKHSVSICVEYLPAKNLGILTLNFNESYDETEVAKKGFIREEILTGMATEAQLIRRAIVHFDAFVEVLNRMSPHDQTEAGDVVPAHLRKQAA